MASNNDVIGVGDFRDYDPDAELESSYANTHTRGSRSPVITQPRKARCGRRQRQRPLLFLDEAKCQQLVESLIANPGLQEKAAEIERLKNQVLTQMAERRQRQQVEESEESDHPVEVIMAAGQYQASGDSRAPTGIDLDIGDAIVANAQGDPLVQFPDDDDEDELIEEVGLDLDLILSPYQARAVRFAQWLCGIHREDVMESMQSGTIVVKDLALGHITGYIIAAFFKKFGKTVLCSTAGGLLLLKFAHSKGYINIDWKKVCDAMIEPDDMDWAQEEIRTEAASTSDEGTVTLYLMDSTNPQVKAGCSIAKKILAVGDWVRENKYLAAGFICGLAFRIIGSKH